jgi:hypothetical protein
MNIMRLRNDKSTSASRGLSHANAPGYSRYLFSRKLTGTVISSTNVTAIPSPAEVFTVFDTAK